MDEIQTLHTPSPPRPCTGLPPASVPSFSSQHRPSTVPRRTPSTRSTLSSSGFRKTGSKRKHGTLRQLKRDPRGCLEQKERGGAWHHMKAEGKVRASSLGILDFLLSARNSLPRVTSKWVTKLDLQVEKIDPCPRLHSSIFGSSWGRQGGCSSNRSGKKPFQS